MCSWPEINAYRFVRDTLRKGGETVMFVGVEGPTAWFDRRRRSNPGYKT